MKLTKCFKTGKKKYHRKEAEKNAKFLRYEKKYRGYTPIAYPCRYCKYWHVGNSDGNYSQN